MHILEQFGNLTTALHINTETLVTVWKVINRFKENYEIVVYYHLLKNIRNVYSPEVKSLKILKRSIMVTKIYLKITHVKLQPYFRGAIICKSHYLYQWWHYLLMHICVVGLNQLNSASQMRSPLTTESLCSFLCLISVEVRHSNSSSLGCKSLTHSPSYATCSTWWKLHRITSGGINFFLTLWNSSQLNSTDCNLTFPIRNTNLLTDHADSLCASTHWPLGYLNEILDK